MADAVNPSRRELELEDVELPVGKEESRVRVVLGSGAQVQAILMATESRKVFITRPSENADKQLIREKFGKFGDIRLLYPYTDSDKWGFLVFKTVEQARAAVDGTKDDGCNAGQAEFLSPVTHNAELRARLSWCRRPARGYGFVEVISPEYHSDCLRKGSFHIGKSNVKMVIDKTKKNALHLTNLPRDVSEDVIRRTLLQALDTREDAARIFGYIIVPRENVGDTDDNELQHLEKEITDKIQEGLKMSTVHVTVWKPKPESVIYKADVVFSSRTEGSVVCRNLRDNFTLQTYKVKTEFMLQITVDAGVMEVCREQYQATLQSLPTDMVTIKIKTTHRGSHLLSITAADVDDVMTVHALLTDVFKADVVNLPNLDRLFTPGGQVFLHETEKEEGAFVRVDNRLRTISVYGSQHACMMVKEEIEEFLELEQQGEVGLVEDVVTLTGGDNPAGLLKALITTHGDDLHGLRVAAGLHNLTVDYRRHKLTLSGNHDSLQKAKDLIQQLKVSLRAASKGDKVGDVECVVCLCPVDVADLYRLKICDHPYCTECLTLQVTFAISGRIAFPITCCHEGCDDSLAWGDLSSLSRAGHITLPALTTAAITSYVRKNPDKARFCTTPDCPMVYRVSAEDQAAVFQCPECGLRTCTACHAQSHDGVTCAMLRERKVDFLETERWVSEDTDNRRACPKCGARIEKTEGCNRMICAACRTIFCWLCRAGSAEFSSEKLCHDHLFNVHGGLYSAQ